MTNQWQPIETAPKDGTKVLLAGPSFLIIGWLEKSHRHPYFIHSAMHADPQSATHWMPLPPPPDPPVTDAQAREAAKTIRTVYSIAQMVPNSYKEHDEAVELLRKWTEQGKPNSDRCERTS